jgi:hypothetical protein
MFFLPIVDQLQAAVFLWPSRGVSLAKRQAGGCAMDIGLGFVGFTILPIKNGDFP